MSDQPSKFNALLARARDGDEAAAEEIVKTYSRGLKFYIRRKLAIGPNGQLRTIMDSVDLEQDTWMHFFASALHDTRTFEDPKAFFTFLARVANNRIRAQCEKYLETQKRDLSHQQPLDEEAV